MNLRGNRVERKEAQNETKNRRHIEISPRRCEHYEEFLYYYIYEYNLYMLDNNNMYVPYENMYARRTECSALNRAR